MTEILLLGTFHYDQSKIDVLNLDSQEQIQELVDQIALFKPDKIAIERPLHAQKAMV